MMPREIQEAALSQARGSGLAQLFQLLPHAVHVEDGLVVERTSVTAEAFRVSAPAREELLPGHFPANIVAESQLSTLPLSPQTEKQAIEEALRRHNGNRSAAASELRMHRSTLWRKLRQYGLEG